MIFSSIPFLYYFLPCVLLAYVLTPARGKNAVLLLFSLIFYAWGEPRYVPVMLCSIVLGYVFGLRMEKYRDCPKRKKLCLTVSVACSLGFLLVFKYADFFIGNVNALTGSSLPLLRLALPIGISFYTFQIISYSVDVYRGQAAQRNIIDLAAYVTLFPQLIAGPIVRYSDIAAELKSRVHSYDSAAEGIRRFVLGLSKKILFSNVLGELCQSFRASGDKSVLFFWLYAIAYTLHIYFDFSGYSDMAIGLGRLFGFSFPENFNYPYISGSITEFWRRWHMSLGSWFRDYVYIPLGGNRVSRGRHFMNILLVWLLTGFWHGAAWNFLFWGLYFAALLMAEKAFLLPRLKKCRFLTHLYVLLLVTVSFVIFDAENMGAAFACLGAMFGGGGYSLVSPEALYCLRSYGVVLLLASVGATPLPGRVARGLRESPRWGRAAAVGETVGLLALMAICTAYLVDGSYNPFLYFRF